MEEYDSSTVEGWLEKRVRHSEYLSCNHDQCLTFSFEKKRKYPVIIATLSNVILYPTDISGNPYHSEKTIKALYKLADRSNEPGYDIDVMHLSCSPYYHP